MRFSRTKRKPSKVRIRNADGSKTVRRQHEFDELRNERRRTGKKPSRPLNDYEGYLRSPRWRELRDQVLKRDGRKCTGCGARANLHVHHLTYKHLGEERLEELVTLCKDCHRDHHALA